MTKDSLIQQAFEVAAERYAAVGVDVRKALEDMKKISLSLHCWQADDVSGFENQGGYLTGGIQVTGNYPGRARTIDELEKLLWKEADKLAQKLRAKGWKNPDASPKMDELLEKIEVLCALVVEADTVAELREIIEGIFTDDLEGILLMTIHKSKGLENDNVFFLAPELIPSRFATQPWQLEQESNLKYVAITRAKNSLIYVPLNQANYDTSQPFHGRYPIQGSRR